jgi:uncharacterized protein (DUF736 family)
LYHTSSVWNVSEFSFQRLNPEAQLQKLVGTKPLRLHPNRKDITMIIGNFSYDPDRDTYAGDITTLTLDRGSVVFRPNEKVGDKEPDYRIVQEHGELVVEFGAAWKRSSERGRDFLSVLLDDPALPSSLNAAMFLAEGQDRATLVWQRQIKKAPPAEAKPAAAEAKPTRSRPRRASTAHSPGVA